MEFLKVKPFDSFGTLQIILNYFMVSYIYIILYFLFFI